MLFPGCSGISVIVVVVVVMVGYCNDGGIVVMAVFSVAVVIRKNLSI